MRIEAPLIDGVNVRYAPNRVMECHALVTPYGQEPFNFLDYFDERVANIAATSLSRFATKTVLDRRNIAISAGDSLPDLPLKNRSASHVFDFVTKLGMQPYGKLRLVDSLGKVKASGLTDYARLTSFIFKDKIVIDPDKSICHQNTPMP